MSEWRECKLEQITEPVKDTYNPTGADDYCYIGLEHIEQESLRISSIGHSTDVTSNKFRFQKNDVLFGRLRPYFRKVVKPEFSGICSTDIWVFRAKKGFDQEFLYYFLANWDFVNTATGGEGGTRMPRADWIFLSQTSWLLPPLPEQRAIASILSSLDDKINLLHRQNATLEAMAETLFRQWFSEPAPHPSPRPSPSGRGSQEAADDAWRELPLSSIADFLNGLACQKHPPKNSVEKLPVLKIRELKSGISETSDWATSEIAEEYVVELGDVIFAWSASLMVKIWDGPKCVLNQHLFKVTSKSYPKWFYLYWCKHHLDEFIAISASHATTMGHIKRGDLDNAMVLVPGQRELESMTKIMEPIIDKKIYNCKQLARLTKLRDILLPKLISGEVRVEHGA